MSSVLVIGASPDTAELARALVEGGYRVIRVEDPFASPPSAPRSWAGLEGDLVAAFALDMPEGFDAEKWAAVVHQVRPTAPAAFAWSRSGTDSWGMHCRKWLRRTAALGAGASTVDGSRAHLAVDLPSDARAASTARGVVRSLVTSGDAAFHEAVALVTSELATNAALHGRPPIHLDAVVDDGGVYVAVEDVGSGPLPCRRDAHRFDEAGRGLTIVAAVADWWGVTALPGRVLVWCDLAP